MPWTTPYTPVPGGLMTAAIWNVQVRDNLNLLKTSISDNGTVWTGAVNGTTGTFSGALVGSQLTVNGVGIVNTSGKIPGLNSTYVGSMGLQATGVLLRFDGSNFAATVAQYPDTAASAGTLLRANGTNWVPSTSTFADTYVANGLLAASSTNTVASLGATPVSSVLLSTSGGIPNWGNTVPLINGGAGAVITAVNGGIVYSTASVLAVSAAGTSGQIVRSAGAASPVWSASAYPSSSSIAGRILISDGTDWVASGPTYPNDATAVGTILRASGSNWVATTTTWPATTTVNRILYSSATSVIGQITSGNSGVLVTDGSGVPSIGTDLPTAVTIGGAYVYRAGGTDVPLLDGGTNASLAAVNGGVVYSTASAFAVSAAGSAGQFLSSAGAASPVWTTATYPSTSGASGTLLQSNGTNIVNTTATYPGTAATVGAYLRADGTNWISSTLILPNAATVNRLVYASATNTYGGSANLTYDGTSFQVNGAGPHAIGTTTLGNTGLTIGGSLAAAGDHMAGIAVTQTVNGAAGGWEMYGLKLATTFVEPASDNHAIYALLIAPTITAGAGTSTRTVGLGVSTFAAASGTTTAAGIYVASAPTGATSNYSIYVNAGLSRLDGGILTSDGTAAAPSLAFTSALDLGLYRVDSRTLGFAANGTMAMTLTDFANANPTLALPSGDKGVGTAGPMLRIGANTNATLNGAGSLNMLNRSSTSYFIWVDGSGDVRINTAAPTNANDTAGTIIGSQSTRDVKNIHGLTVVTPEQALQAVLTAPVYDYEYANGKYSGSQFTGLLIDDSPWIGMDPDVAHPHGRSFNPMTALGYSVLAFKALQAEVEALRARLN